MNAPPDFFTAPDLSRIISAQNTVHPLSNADLYPPEPEQYGISRSQHALIVALQMACTLNEIPITQEESDERRA